jgi:hypothetical protein
MVQPLWGWHFMKSATFAIYQKDINILKAPIKPLGARILCFDDDEKNFWKKIIRNHC